MKKKMGLNAQRRMLLQTSSSQQSSWRSISWMWNQLRAPFDHCGDRRRMFRLKTWVKTFCSSISRVIEHESWTYNKHLVIFEKMVANIPISALAFQFTSFWIQIHSLPIHCLNPETRDEGSSLGTTFLMTNSESNEEGLSLNWYYQTS